MEKITYEQAIKQVKSGNFFDPVKEKDVLQLADDDGGTVAHWQAAQGFSFNPVTDKDILQFADNRGYTVAHVQAEAGFGFDPVEHKDILMLADHSGLTVAHRQAQQNGFSFDEERDKEILMLADVGGTTVSELWVKPVSKLRATAAPPTQFTEKEADVGALKSVRKNEVQNILEKLRERLTEFTNEDVWKNYLAFSSKLPSYSARNSEILFFSGAEPPFASYGGWQKVGRYVNKGERGYRIIAPIIKPDEEDPTKKVVKGFKPTSVFSVSQTSGEPIPSPVTLLTQKGDEGVFNDLKNAARKLRYKVIEVDEIKSNPNANGLTIFSKGMIFLREDLPPAQKIKTLCHELGHIVSEHDLRGDTLDDRKISSRAMAEFEAESIAYVMCSKFTIDSGDYTLGYLSTWARGNPELAADVVKDIAEHVHMGVSKIEKLLPDVALPHALATKTLVKELAPEVNEALSIESAIEKDESLINSLENIEDEEFLPPDLFKENIQNSKINLEKVIDIKRDMKRKGIDPTSLNLGVDPPLGGYAKNNESNLLQQERVLEQNGL